MATTPTTARLKLRYQEEIRPALIERFGYSSMMQAPRVEKITVNMGVGDAKQDTKVLEAAQEQLATIAGQRPSVRRARKSIAAFKLREGMPVGVAVTLRRERAYEFLDRLTSVAIPRIRDFRGLNPRSFDGRGNYSMGVREQIIFPEVDYDAVDQVRGLDITITTTAASDAEAFALLEALGMPFAREGRPAGFDTPDTPDVDADARAREQQLLDEAHEKAEAEQAARDQLREEDPETYGAPTPDADAEGDAAADASPGRRDARHRTRIPRRHAAGRRRRRPDRSGVLNSPWPRPHSACASRVRRSSPPAPILAATAVAARERSTASSCCAASACATSRTMVRSPG